MEGKLTVIEYNGENYITISEVAQHLRISRSTCTSNVLPTLTECYLPGRVRALYKQSEVEQLSHVRTVGKHSHSLTLVKPENDQENRRDVM